MNRKAYLKCGWRIGRAYLQIGRHGYLLHFYSATLVAEVNHCRVRMDA